MNLFFKSMESLLVGTYRLLRAVIRAFEKAIEIIRPRGLVEWLVLLVAVPVPFGVTALFIYKYLKQK